MVFQHPSIPNSRSGQHSSRMQEAIVDFTADLSIHEPWKSCVGVIIEREVHELLEFAQLTTNPGVAPFNPHHYTQDLADVVERVVNAVLKHAG